MYWTDGSIYKGMWHKGIQHGKGRMEFPDGKTKEGMFENNIFQGPVLNRLNLYQKQNYNNTNYSSLDKIANSTTATFESDYKQNRTVSQIDSFKKRKKLKAPEPFTKIFLENYRAPFNQKKMSTIQYNNAPIKLDACYTDGLNQTNIKDVYVKSKFSG